MNSHDSHEHSEKEYPPDWNTSLPEHIPPPSAAPFFAAGGITCLCWGLLTSPIVSLIGIVVFGIALAIWIKELRNE